VISRGESVWISAIVWGRKLAAAIVVTPIIYAVIEKKFGIHPAPVEVGSAGIEPSAG
jgi:hypothetical protein